MERIQSASETGGTSDGIAPIPSTDQTYTAEDILRTMPMQEYLAGYRDFGRVRGYCHGCSRFGTCWACPPYSFDEEQCLRRYGTIDLLATRITPAEGIVLTREVSEEIIRKERRRLDAMLLRREREAGLDESGSNLQARAFFAGTCLLCPPEQCTRRCNAPCPSSREHTPVSGSHGVRHITHCFRNIRNPAAMGLRRQSPCLSHTCKRSRLLKIIFHFSSLFTIFAL